MEAFHPAARVDELCEGVVKTVQIDGKKIAVVCVNDCYYAVDALCSHMGVSLDQGKVEGEEIVCPWHSARFSVKTGSKTHGRPNWCDLSTYPVRVVDNLVEVALPVAVSA